MPKVVDNYVFERKIGSGQYGDVFKGYNKNNGTDIAIKAIKRQHIKGKAFMMKASSWNYSKTKLRSSKPVITGTSSNSTTSRKLPITSTSSSNIVMKATSWPSSKRKKPSLRMKQSNILCRCSMPSKPQSNIKSCIEISSQPTSSSMMDKLKLLILVFQNCQPITSNSPKLCWDLPLTWRPKFQEGESTTPKLIYGRQVHAFMNFFSARKYPLDIALHTRLEIWLT